MRLLFPLFLMLALPRAAEAGEVKAAVAANFTAAMKAIAAGFEGSTGHRVLASYGSTGKLYAQIENGAPFEVFLAADQTRPAMLESAGAASGRFTYAVGRLVLWSADPDLIDATGSVLKTDRFKRLAIANPATAPYGVAAMQVLAALNLDDALQSKLVRGDSIAQTYQFVATGNAGLGFVALALVALNPSGSRWDVPQTLYAPIRQDAVLLRAGAENAAAAALLAYLQSAPARTLIERFGYGTE